MKSLQKVLFITIFIVSLYPGQLIAGTANDTSYLKNQNSSLELSAAVEPFAPMLKGVAAEVNLFSKGHRAGISINQIEVPPFYNSQSDDFSVFRSFIDVHYTYFLSGEHKGFNTGIGVGILPAEEVTDIKAGSNVKKSKSLTRFSLRLGYLWRPFNGNFYIEPSGFIGFTPFDNDLPFESGKTYKKNVMFISAPMFMFGHSL